MHDQADNLTQTRGSLDESPTVWFKIRSFICPCLLPSSNISVTSKQQQIDLMSISKASVTNQSSNHNNRDKLPMHIDDNMTIRRNKSNHRKGSQEIGQLEYNRRQGLLNKKPAKYQKEFRETLNIQMGYQRALSIEERNCVIGTLAQNQLISIGIGDRHLLAKVKTANINTNLSLLKKDIQISKKKKDPELNFIGQQQLNKFWNQRYILFQKFDEGIAIDDSSWSHIPPEQVSDYIATKCCGAKKILNGFAGVGGTTIKLASINSTAKIIANDYNGKKTKILLNNAKVYEVDSNIELNEQDFLKIQRKQLDVVFVQPPVNKLQNKGQHSLSIVDFEPTLDHIIIKALKLAPNFMMLLPPETSIDLICSCLNKCASELKKMTDFCSILIEKIYFQSQFLYILISMGKIVQNEIKLNDELNYIYTKLKKSEQKYFRHKKIIKKIRQDRGMLELFNLLRESQKKLKQKQNKNTVLGKEQYLIDCFYELIRQKQYLTSQKLQKIIEQQNIYYQKKMVQMNIEKLEERQGANLQDISMSTVMEEEKVIQTDAFFRQSEPTESEPSNHYSYMESFDKNFVNNQPMFLRKGRIQSDNFNNVTVKRMYGSKQKKDVSPKARNDSPLTPRKYGKNRAPQILQKHQNDIKMTKTAKQRIKQ